MELTTWLQVHLYCIREYSTTLAAEIKVTPFISQTRGKALVHYTTSQTKSTPSLTYQHSKYHKHKENEGTFMFMYANPFPYPVPSHVVNPDLLIAIAFNFRDISCSCFIILSFEVVFVNVSPTSSDTSTPFSFFLRSGFPSFFLGRSRSGGDI